MSIKQQPLRLSRNQLKKVEPMFQICHCWQRVAGEMQEKLYAKSFSEDKHTQNKTRIRVHD